MNRAALHIAALILPLLGLAGLWLNTDRASRQGTEWDVPIQGYDPRDMLQGHYVQFQYDWPGLSNEAQSDGSLGALCVVGKSPLIQRVERYPSGDKNGPYCESFVRVSYADSSAPQEGWSGRLYASQDEALRLETALRDPAKQGMVRIRLRPDGHITPLRITFRPRPPEPQAAP